MKETAVILVDPLEPSRIVPFGARLWTRLSGLAAATIAVGAAVVVAVALGVAFGPAEAGAAAGAVVAASLVRFLWVRDDLRPLLANARPVPDRVAVASSPTVSASRVAWDRIVDRVYFLALAGLAAYYVETVRGFVLPVVAGLIVGGVLGELGVRRLVADHERRTPCKSTSAMTTARPWRMTTAGMRTTTRMGTPTAMWQSITGTRPMTVSTMSSGPIRSMRCQPAERWRWPTSLVSRVPLDL